MSKTPDDNHKKRSTRSTAKSIKQTSENQSTPSHSPNTSIAKPQKEKQRISEASKRKANFGKSASPETSQHAKKPALTMSTITIDDIQKILDSHNNKIAETIKTTVHSELMSFGEQLKTEINSKIAEVNVKIDAVQANVNVQRDQLSTIQSSVNNCIMRITINEDDCNRIGKLNELKIKGIPHKDGENLQTIFESIAKQVGYDLAIPNNVPELNRMQTRSNKENVPIPAPTIIVKFVAQHIRDKFYGMYLSRIIKQPLMTEHIDLPQGSRIIIGEMLTASNQNLFVAAMKLKREKKLTTVFTKNGLVTIKKSAVSKPTTIRSSRDLDEIIESTPSTPAANNLNGQQNTSTVPPSTPQSTSSAPAGLTIANGQQTVNSANADTNKNTSDMDVV